MGTRSASFTCVSSLAGWLLMSASALRTKLPTTGVSTLLMSGRTRSIRAVTSESRPSVMPPQNTRHSVQRPPGSRQLPAISTAQSWHSGSLQ
jgi:hypothetical protein